MTEGVSPVSGNTTAGVQQSGNAGGGQGYDANTTITSMEDLKTKAPKLYKAMVEGIAMNIVSSMRRSQARLKKTKELYKS